MVEVEEIEEAIKRLRERTRVLNEYYSECVHDIRTFDLAIAALQKWKSELERETKWRRRG